MKQKPFIPIFGQVYETQLGGQYRCVTPPYISYPVGEARMRNEATGYVCRVHGLRLRPDGYVEWDYSSGGYYDESMKPKKNINRIQRDLQ